MGRCRLHGRWLLAAARAQAFWQEAAKDTAFQKQIERVCVVYIPDFGITATITIMQLKEYRTGFVMALGSDECGDFVMMTMMGFFQRTGECYRMALPPVLTAATVKAAMCRYAGTEDEEYFLHPEYLMSTMSSEEARNLNARLSAISEFRTNSETLSAHRSPAH